MALGIYNKVPIYPIFYLLKGDYAIREKSRLRILSLACLLSGTSGNHVGCVCSLDLCPEKYNPITRGPSYVPFMLLY